MIAAISLWVTGRGVTGRRNRSPRTASSWGRIAAIAGGRDADVDDGAGSGDGGTGWHSGSALAFEGCVGDGAVTAAVGEGLGPPLTAGPTWPVTHELSTKVATTHAATASRRRLIRVRRPRRWERDPRTATVA